MRCGSNRNSLKRKFEEQRYRAFIVLHTSRAVTRRRLSSVLASEFGRLLPDLKIITTLCPGGNERMRRSLAVVASGQVHLKSLVAHRFKLEQIEAAYDLFSHQRDWVLKVARTP